MLRLRTVIHRQRQGFVDKCRLGQREVVYRPTRHVGRVVNGVGPWDCVRQSALVSHVIMLVGGLMVAIAEYRQRRLRLGRREERFPRVF